MCHDLRETAFPASYLLDLRRSFKDTMAAAHRAVLLDSEPRPFHLNPQHKKSTLTSRDKTGTNESQSMDRVHTSPPPAVHLHADHLVDGDYLRLHGEDILQCVPNLELLHDSAKSALSSVSMHALKRGGHDEA